MIEKVEMLIYLMLIGGAISGWRKGFFREVLVFCCWVPAIYAIVTIMIRNFDPTSGIDGESQATIKLIMALFAASWVVVALSDAFILKPMLKDMADKSLVFVNSIGGSLFATTRVFALLVVGMAMYDIYVKPINDVASIHQSSILRTAKYMAADFVAYLRDNGHISSEQTLYDLVEEQEKEMRKHYEDLAPGISLPGGFGR